MKSNKAAINDLGWQSGFRLATYYTLFFIVVMASIFFIAYNIISNTIRKDELTLVTSQAKEYHTWYITGDLLELESRMNEQLVNDGDILFVHIRGPNLKYTNSHSGDK